MRGGDVRLDPAAPVGIFDSGVGGLSVWRQLAHQLPAESLLYLADQAHVPYGDRSVSEIREFCLAVGEALVGQGCKAIVVACNTASAVALQALRQRWPQVPILGLEPAVKPAVAATRSRVVGVMATPATFQGELYRATVGQYGAGVTVVEQVCPGLADLVERGSWESPEGVALIQSFLEPMLAAGADTIVLGCTHYPFVIDTIRRLVGPTLEVIDPAPAVARHLARVLAARELLRPQPPPPGFEQVQHRFFSTTAADCFERDTLQLLGRACPCEERHWQQEHAAAERRLVRL